MISDYEDVVRRVETVPGVVAATPFILSQVLLSAEGNVHGVVLRGIDPAREGEVTDIEKNLVSGSLSALLPPNEAVDAPTQPGIIVGRELALRLGLFLGGTVNVISPSGKPGPLGIVPKIRRFTVTGIFESGMYEYDSSLAYIAITTAQDFFGYGNEVSGVEVKITDIFEAGAVATVIEEELGYPFWARDWLQMNRNLFLDNKYL